MRKCQTEASEQGGMARGARPAKSGMLIIGQLGLTKGMDYD